MDIQAIRIESLARELIRLVLLAKQQGIPVEVIARTARLAKKTVYRRLAEQEDGRGAHPRKVEVD